MARRKHNSRRHDPAPGWVWMLFGLGLGLIVAVGVYLRSPQSSPGSAPAVARTTSPSAVERAATRTPPTPAATPAAEADNRFDFYEILPQFEVDVPAADQHAAPSVRSRPVEEPGRYVLQAGSFGAAADADRLQASLALRGVESHVQRVTIDGAVFHRVRIGPISDLAVLDRTRRQLRDAGIDALVMKAPN